MYVTECVFVSLAMFVLTLSLTCVRLRSHFSLELEGEKGAESELSISWAFT